MLTDTFAGRCLLWRAPTDGDLRRFPASAVGVPPAPVPGAGPSLALSALALPSSGRWPAGSLQALLESSDSTAFVVLRGGRLGFEWYAAGWNGATPGRTMSVTKSVAELLARDLWCPLGAGEATLSLDHRGGGSLAHLESGLNATAYGLARLGQLVLQRGLWEGRTLVPQAWLARLDDLADAWRHPEHFAYYREHRLPWARPLASGRFAYKDFWWLHCPEAGVHDLFAMGALGAHVYISRDTDFVIVRLARRFPPGLWWAGLLRRVAEAAAAT